MRNAFLRNQGDFKELYGSTLRRNPSLREQMDVAIAIEPKGTVAAVALINSELNDHPFEKAVLLMAGMLQFGPASGEGLYVLWWPFIFVSP